MNPITLSLVVACGLVGIAVDEIVRPFGAIVSGKAISLSSALRSIW
jgi:hypothetical protein